MKKISNYIEFLIRHGRPLAADYPGSPEIALNIADCLAAVDMLYQNDVLIFGGDVLTESNGRLIYAIHKWGYEYSYLSWSVDQKMVSENMETYIAESHRKAREFIFKAEDVASSKNSRCFIVLSIETT